MFHHLSNTTKFLLYLAKVRQLTENKAQLFFMQWFFVKRTSFSVKAISNASSDFQLTGFFLLSSRKSVETECQNWLTDWRIRSSVMFTPEQFLCQVPAILETGPRCPADNKLLKHVGYKRGNETNTLDKENCCKMSHKPITVVEY